MVHKRSRDCLIFSLRALAFSRLRLATWGTPWFALLRSCVGLPAAGCFGPFLILRGWLPGTRSETLSFPNDLNHWIFAKSA